MTRWCISNGTLMRTYKGHTAPCNALCVMDGVLYSGSDDTHAMRWDVESGDVLQTYIGHVAGVIAVCCGLGKTLRRGVPPSHS